MALARPRVSFADLVRAPDDGLRRELYDGEVRVVPAPILRHQWIVQEIYLHVRAFADANGGLAFVSPVDIVLTDYDVVQPDIVVFGSERRPLLDLDTPTRHPPDLAIEVLSASTEAIDRGRKQRLLARHRVPEYWIVDPVAERIEVLALHGPAYVPHLTAMPGDTVTSARFPGLRFAAASIFPPQQA